MKENKALRLGTQPISKILMEQAIPASIGILVMSLNMMVDTIFVGKWIGPMAIAAITVVMPIVFLISSIGMSIGVGGSSIISRALGSGDKEKAQLTFGNQIMFSATTIIALVMLGLIFEDQFLHLFGAKGNILAPAKEYYHIVMFGVPFLATAMTGNTIIRAEGQAKFAMVALIIPAVVNIFLDYVFIYQMNLGMSGAAYATAISFFMSFGFILWFFVAKSTSFTLRFRYLILNWSIIKEISSLGVVTLARQAVVSLLAIVINNALFQYDGEMALAIYGIISRLLMFALFPVLGITQGFLPIAGYNYGAEKFERVRETIRKSIQYATLIAVGIFLVIMIFPEQIVSVFTDNKEILASTPKALRIVFAITPLISIQLIGSGYFQAIGKAFPALLLTLTKQGFFLIPLILILPKYFGVLGIWIAFPIADFASTLITYYFLRKEVINTLIPEKKVYEKFKNSRN